MTTLVGGWWQNNDLALSAVKAGLGSKLQEHLDGIASSVRTQRGHTCYRSYTIT